MCHHNMFNYALSKHVHSKWHRIIFVRGTMTYFLRYVRRPLMSITINIQLTLINVFLSTCIIHSYKHASFNYSFVTRSITTGGLFFWIFLDANSHKSHIIQSDVSNDDRCVCRLIIPLGPVSIIISSSDFFRSLKIVMCHQHYIRGAQCLLFSLCKQLCVINI